MVIDIIGSAKIEIHVNSIIGEGDQITEFIIFE